jgi:hypothetical protein
MDGISASTIVDVIIKIEADRNKLITTLIYELLPHVLIRNIDQHLVRVAQALDRMKPSTPRCWRGEQLGHHGRGVFSCFCVLWLLSYRLGLVVCVRK